MNDSPLAGPEWAGFLTSMRFRGDDTDFLVAADWLQDQSGPEFEAWAEFVRCQVATAAADRAGPRSHVYTDSCDCERCRPERRAALLYDRWGVHWLAHSFPRVEGVRYEAATLRNFRRGFPISADASIDDYRLATVPRQAGELFRRAPLEIAGVRLADASPSVWHLLASFESTTTPRNFRVLISLAGGVRPRIGSAPIFSPGELSAGRLVGPRRRLDRAIGGAVRDVLRRRNDCFVLRAADLAPAPDLGGES